MNDEGLIWEAYKRLAPISLGIDKISIVKRKAGDGFNYGIFDNSVKPRKMIGHISGFEKDYGKFKGMFHLYKTELTEEARKDPLYHNKGIYRTAIQKVANLYPNGLYVATWEASILLQKSLAKMPTYQLVNDEIYDNIIFIKPEKTL
jgi:hypothetical protein